VTSKGLSTNKTHPSLKFCDQLFCGFHLLKKNVEMIQLQAINKKARKAFDALRDSSNQFTLEMNFY